MAFAAARWEVLRSNVGEIGQLAASAVDGDLHRRLLDPTQYSDELYAAALYTMAERDGGTVFVLDTAASPDLRTKHQLRASAYMEPFEIREEYDDGWTKEVAAGKTYVTPSFQQDDFLIYAPDCDAQAAKDIAAAILARIAGQGMPLAGAADYASLHREADTALHQARAEGRNRIVIFDAAMAVPPQPGSPPKILV
jgi:hypothetical protein